MIDVMTQNILIGTIADFPDGEIRPAAMPDGTTLAVYNVDGTIYATADLCTHGEASLSEEGILTVTDALGCSPADFILDSYRGLFASFAVAHNLSARDMLFDTGDATGA